MNARHVVAEWLDTLPDEDPRARRSRRELARVNALMANARIVAGGLAACGLPAHVVELGSGDGRFALRLARAIGITPEGARLTLVDRQASIDREAHRRLEALGWRVEAVQADVFEWLSSGGEPAGAIVANLFLHHFEDDPLERLLALAAHRARCFVACEPRRSALGLAGAHLLALAGCGPVTRHDAVVSVRAGFRDPELTTLWPRTPGWNTTEGARGLFSHAFTAVRA